MNDYMIRNRHDLQEWILADEKARNAQGRFGFKAWLTEPIRRYQRLLRKREYLINAKPNHGIWRLIRIWNSFWLRRLGIKLGFDIPPNCFGPGLYITHPGTIVVNPKTRVGRNCVLNVCVNIGHDEKEEAPTIGDNCFIAPGAKLFGGIVLGDNVKIGANAVVNKSFPDGNCTLVGVPAQKTQRT